MKKRIWLLLVPLALAVGAVGVLLGVISNPVAAGGSSQIAQIEAKQTFKHVEFTLTWSGGVETGTYPFTSGEGTQLIMTGTHGTKSFAIDYSYWPGKILTYTAEFSVFVNSLEGNVAVATIVVDDQNPACGIKFSQDFNHVIYTATWSGGDPFGQFPFGFGDVSASDVLTGPDGEKVLPHDYGYQVGGVISYTAGFSVSTPTGEATDCHQIITIDDRPTPPPPPTMTHQIYLPLISFQQQLGIFLHTDVGPSWNHVTAHIKWSGAKHVFLEWGDVSGVESSASQGDEILTHDYDYRTRSVTIVLSVESENQEITAISPLQLHP